MPLPPPGPLAAAAAPAPTAALAVGTASALAAIAAPAAECVRSALLLLADACMMLAKLPADTLALVLASAGKPSPALWLLWCTAGTPRPVLGRMRRLRRCHSIDAAVLRFCKTSDYLSDALWCRPHAGAAGCMQAMHCGGAGSIVHHSHLPQPSHWQHMTTQITAAQHIHTREEKGRGKGQLCIPAFSPHINSPLASRPPVRVQAGECFQQLWVLLQQVLHVLLCNAQHTAGSLAPHVVSALGLGKALQPQA